MGTRDLPIEDEKKRASSIAFRVQLSVIIVSFISIAFAYYTTYQVSDLADGLINNILRKGVFVQLVVMLFFNIVLGIIIYGAITKPLRKLCSIISEISEGNLQTDIPYTNERTEIGELAEKIKLLRNRSLAQLEMEKVSMEYRNREMDERRRKFDELAAKQFDERVMTIAKKYQALTQKLMQNAQNLANATIDSGSYIDNLAQLSDYASDNINSIAMASEGLTSSIAKIKEQTAKSAIISEDATFTVNSANKNVTSLAESAEKIGNVAELINDIAEQINLLSLNATIEAARAGEAGRGFAVVASEVKSLAEQTAKATEEISSQIGNIHGQSISAVNSIKEINNTIVEINNICKDIAESVALQNLATVDISKNIHEAAQHNANLKQNADNSAKAFDGVESHVTELQRSSSEISASTENFNNEINSFFDIMKRNLNS